jgi:hypothetical protein
MIKKRLILTVIFIEMGVMEIEYELNKINVFTKINEEPTLLRNTHQLVTQLINIHVLSIG